MTNFEELKPVKRKSKCPKCNGVTLYDVTKDNVNVTECPYCGYVYNLITLEKETYSPFNVDFKSNFNGCSKFRKKTDAEKCKEELKARLERDEDEV